MDLNQAIVILGCFNALIFAGVLFSIKVNVKANILLAFLILSLGLNLILSQALSLGLFDTYPILHLLPFGVGFGLGPLIYLYTVLLCTNKKPNYTHLLFFLADYPHSIYHLILGRESEGIVHDFTDKFGFFSLLVLIYYLWRSWKAISKYQGDIKNNLSNVSHQTLTWLKQIIILFMVSLPMFLIMWILIITIGLDFNDRLVGYMYYVFAIFWLGIGGIRQHQLLSKNKVNTTPNDEKKDAINQGHIEALIHQMEVEKLYLYPDLDIRLLEARSHLTARQISDVLNSGLKKNFYRFINEYRVEEFKQKVKVNSNLTLYGIAMESGFNSKATFQRVFKEITGMRPSEYAKSLT